MSISPKRNKTQHFLVTYHYQYTTGITLWNIRHKSYPTLSFVRGSFRITLISRQFVKIIFILFHAAILLCLSGVWHPFQIFWWHDIYYRTYFRFVLLYCKIKLIKFKKASWELSLIYYLANSDIKVFICFTFIHANGDVKKHSHFS